MTCLSCGSDDYQILSLDGTGLLIVECMSCHWSWKEEEL